MAVAGFACVAVAAQTQTATQWNVQTLDTPSFTIRIEVKCPEGDVVCKNVIYQGKSKKTQNTLSLQGITAHTMCADKVTPCRFLGYLFRSGRVTYFISDAGELVVRDGQKVVVREQGTWH